MSLVGPSLNGCLFRYAHEDGEPAETLEMAKRVACTVAEAAAIDQQQSYIVARRIEPRGYVVFPIGHEGLSAPGLVPTYEISPDSTCLRLVH